MATTAMGDPEEVTAGGPTEVATVATRVGDSTEAPVDMDTEIGGFAMCG
jgi:hypothetical protein